MTYLTFLLVFVGLPATLLTAVIKHRRHHLGRRVWLALLGVSPIAVVYTARWDQYLIAQKVWWYGEDRVLGAWLGVPYEEYGFMMLQPVLTGALLLALLSRRSRLQRPLVVGLSSHLGGLPWAALLLLVGRGGGVSALRSGPEWTYLGLILVWAFPVIAALTVGAWPGLRLYAREAATAWAISTLYLGAADHFAIGRGIWTIGSEQSTGWMIAGLPFEEGLFFAATNALVVAGAVLFWSPGLPEEKLGST